MEHNLLSRLGLELFRLCEKGTAGEAIEKYLLDEKREKIKIPNAVYCFLYMLNVEHETSDTIYIEYSGVCMRTKCTRCRGINDGEGYVNWYFWYTAEQSEILNLTAVPAHEVEIAGELDLSEEKENEIRLKFSYKMAYQCMAAYDTECECYLPRAFFKMVKFALLFCSYKAFFAALKSAVKRSDEEGNYVIREVLKTVLGLSRDFGDEQRVEQKGYLYKKLCRISGTEVAAVSRAIGAWETDDDLEKRLSEMIDQFSVFIKSRESRNWVTENEEALKKILGEELCSQMKEYCLRNSRV